MPGWKAGGVSGLEFVASLVRSLAWPAAMVVVVVMLRRPLIALLEAPLRRFKLGPAGFELEWAHAAGRVRGELPPVAGPAPGELTGREFRQEMLRLAEDASPAAAVVASLGRVEDALRAMLTAAGVEAPKTANATELVRLARRHDLVDDPSVNAVEGLGVMHMLGVLDDGGRHLDLRRAEEFIALAEAVLFTLRMHATRGQPR